MSLKKFLSAFIALTMLIGMLSAFAISINAEESYLKIANATLNDGQYLIKGSVNPVNEIPDNTESYAYYKDGILTLHNYSLKSSGFAKMIEAKGINLKILLEGENLLDGLTATNDVTAIYSDRGLEIMGFGSLTITNVNCGIDRSTASGGQQFTITDATINITAINEAINSKYRLSVTAAKLFVTSTASGKAAIRNLGEIYIYASEIEAYADGCAIQTEREFETVVLYGSSLKAVSSEKQAVKCYDTILSDDGIITAQNTTITASKNADGSSPETYERSKVSTYKYIECKTPDWVVLSFDANGGSGYTKSVALSKTDKLDANYPIECTFTAPENKYFTRWDATIYGVTFSENKTVKAKWDWKTDVNYVEFAISGYEAGASASNIRVTEVTRDIVVDSSTIKVKVPPHETATTIEADRYYNICFEFYFPNPERYNLNFDLTDRSDFRICGMAAAENVKYNAETGRYSVIMTGEPIPETDVNVKFYANESDAEPIKTISAKGIYTLPSPEDLSLAIPEGKIFAGWKWTDSNAYSNIYGWNPVYQPNDYCFVALEMTLVAQWDDIPMNTVTFYKNDGTEDVVKAETVATGSTYSVSNLPKLDDVGEKKFMGWTKANDSDIIIENDFVVSADTSLYALWVEYPEKITFKLEGYEIGKNVMDIKLTDDKGFLPNNNLILEGQGRFIIYEDNNGKPAIVMTEEEYNNYLEFVNGKFEEGKSYWIIVIPEYDGYHEGADGRWLSLPNSPDAYKLEGAEDAQVIINGELYAYGFKLKPLSTKVDEPSDGGATTPPDNSGLEDSSESEKATDEVTDEATDSNTEATDDKAENKGEETEAPAKSGCGSSIAISTLAIAGLMGTALIIKKKEN